MAAAAAVAGSRRPGSWARCWALGLVLGEYQGPKQLPINSSNDQLRWSWLETDAMNQTPGPARWDQLEVKGNTVGNDDGAVQPELAKWE